MRLDNDYLNSGYALATYSSPPGLVKRWVVMPTVWPLSLTRHFWSGLQYQDSSQV